MRILSRAACAASVVGLAGMFVAPAHAAPFIIGVESYWLKTPGQTDTTIPVVPPTTDELPDIDQNDAEEPALVDTGGLFEQPSLPPQGGTDNLLVTQTPNATVTEPASLALFGLGLAAIALLRRPAPPRRASGLR